MTGKAARAISMEKHMKKSSVLNEDRTRQGLGPEKV